MRRLLPLALLVWCPTLLHSPPGRCRGKTYVPGKLGTKYTPLGRKWRKKKPHKRMPLVRLKNGPGFVVARPDRAWGTRLAVYQINRIMALYRQRFPKAPPALIHDLSRRGGGVLDNHNSHVDGRDVDIPLVLEEVRDAKVDGPRKVNLERTYFIVKAMADSCDIEYMFLDREVQRQLYEYGRLSGVEERELELLLQYPAAETAKKGVVRHWPNHQDHVHVRFRYERAELLPAVKAYCDWRKASR